MDRVKKKNIICINKMLRRKKRTDIINVGDEQKWTKDRNLGKTGEN